jgi:hypothetical protein
MAQDFLKQIEAIVNSALGILQIIATFLVAFLVVLWFTLCFWTFRDIQSRTRDLVAQVFSVMLVLFFNIPGVLLYILVRPKETLAQAYERSLQEEYILQDLEEREICPTCRVKTQPDFAFCFNCRTRLRRECTGCGHLIKLKWTSCPFCGTPQKTRPRDTLAGQAAPGLGSPRTSGQTALATTGPTTASLYQNTNGQNYANQPYADGGLDYPDPNAEEYLTQLTNRKTDNLTNGRPAPEIMADDPTVQTGRGGARYKPPRERRNRNAGDPDEN